MNYRECRAYIEHAGKYGMVPGLDNMEELLTRLGNPQEQLSFIHIAGTNGKGSTLAFLQSVLCTAGYQTGSYYSPAVFTDLETVQVNGQKMTESLYAKCMTQTAQVSDAMQREGFPHPTSFEMETAAAFLAFVEEHCEIVLLETGMGGMLDATNLVKHTLVAILTPISMDHMAYLGDTLTEISRNKAGIIKPGSTVVTANQQPEAMSVIHSTCRRFKVPLVIADAETARMKERTGTRQRFVYHGHEWEIGLAGACQIENAVTALTVLEVLTDRGYTITTTQIETGMRNMFLGGRFTILDTKPVIVLDGAHNPAAAESLTKSLRIYFADRKLYYIMGMFKDKDVKTVAEMTAPLAEEILTVSLPDKGRTLSTEKLARTVREFHSHVLAMDSLSAALDAAVKRAGPEDVIVAFGSLSFLGPLQELIEERQR